MELADPRFHLRQSVLNAPRYMQILKNLIELLQMPKPDLVKGGGIFSAKAPTQCPPFKVISYASSTPRMQNVSVKQSSSYQLDFSTQLPHTILGIR